MIVRPQPRRLAALAVALATALVATAAVAQWAWKEDNGRVVYSDRPPPANIRAGQILRQPAVPVPPPARGGTPAAGAEADKAASAPAAAQAIAPAAPKSYAEREMEFRKRQQERADAERKAQEDQQKSAARAAECDRSRGYLKSLEDGVRVMRTDAAGNREFLDDAQRATEVERMRKLVQQHCT